MITFYFFVEIKNLQMKSSGNLSLKKSYKHLQQKMWKISSQSYQLNKQNEFLRCRMNTQRMTMKKKKKLTISLKDTEEENKMSGITRNFQIQYMENQRLKQKIANIEENKKEMQKNIEQLNSLEKKNHKLFLKLRKYNNKLKKYQNYHSAPIGLNKLQEQEAKISGQKQAVDREQQQLISQIQQCQKILYSHKRHQNQLGEQILELIDEKNKLKKLQKAQNINMKQKSKSKNFIK